MNEPIFRKKSLERISSPEEIDKYMKVTSPSMWLLMVAIVLLLMAAVIWSITGRIETTMDIATHSENGEITVLISAEDMNQLAVGSEVRAGNIIGNVTEIKKQEGNFLVSADIPQLQDGAVEVTFVTECIAPITFLVD